MPLYVRAGSIVPFGPELQYTAEKPANPITLFVYAGADGAVTLYEDDGLTYGYERGAFTRIPIQWNDTTKVLTRYARATHVRGRVGFESQPGWLFIRTTGRLRQALSRGKGRGSTMMINC